jgi:hypothetical protein
MANRDNPHGLAPLGRNLSGGCLSVQEYTKDASAGTAIFINDAVSIETDGNLIATGTPGSLWYQGVALNGGPALTLSTHLVIDDPTAIFEAQDNADVDGFAAADRGELLNLELNAGNALSGISGHEIDESAIDEDVQKDVKLLRLLEMPGNDYGSHGRWEIMFNRHFLTPGAVGI